MTDLHVADLAAGYAFGALSPDDRTRVEFHCEVCTACEEACAIAKHCAALLAYVVTPYRAPADLKEALLLYTGGEVTDKDTERPVSFEPSQSQDSNVQTSRVDTLRIGFPWRRILLVSVPWTVAVAGWLVAGTLLIFSHGQSDRLATTRLDNQSQVTALAAQLDDALVIRDFMLTPGVQAAPLIYQAGTARHTNVTLFYAPGYIHAVVAARGLAKLPQGKVYCVWAVSRASGYVPLGTLSTSGIRAEGVALLVAPQSLDRYGAVAISIEHTPAPRTPDNSLIFLLKERTFAEIGTPSGTLPR